MFNLSPGCRSWRRKMLSWKRSSSVWRNAPRLNFLQGFPFFVLLPMWWLVLLLPNGFLVAWGETLLRPGSIRMPQKWTWGWKWKSIIWKEFGRNMYEICPFLTHWYWIPTCASDAGAVAGTDYRWARDRNWQGWRTRLPTDRRTESQSWSADLIEKFLFYFPVFLLLFTVFPPSRPLFGKPFLGCFWDEFSPKPWGDAQGSQQIQLTMELQETGDTKTDQLLRKANLCESQPEPQEVLLANETLQQTMVQELEHQEKLPDVKENTEKVTGWWLKINTFSNG